MRKKDYELIAGSLCDSLDMASGAENITPERVVRAVIIDLAMTLKEENPRFDEIKFYNHAGIEIDS